MKITDKMRLDFLDRESVSLERTLDSRKEWMVFDWHKMKPVYRKRVRSVIDTAIRASRRNGRKKR